MFRFKQFDIDDAGCGMKIGTDSVLLGAWTDLAGASRVLDAGCGSGLLALMVAQRAQNADITAVEIDQGAATAASANFSASPWGSRLHCVCADVMQFDDEGYDLVICNPPYFSTGMLSPDACRATARHGGPGLSPLSAIGLAARVLSPGGSLAMVTPADSENAIVFASEMSRLKVRRLCRVSTVEGKKPSRLLWQLSAADALPAQSSVLSIRDAAGHYTSEYAGLTSPFYINM